MAATSARAEWASLVNKHRYLMDTNPEADFSKVDPQLLEAVVARDIRLLKKGENYFKLNPINYTKRLNTLIQFEKVHSDIQMRRFDQPNIQVQVDKQALKDGKVWFKYVMAGLSKGHPKVIPGDLIILDDDQNKPEQFMIEEIEGDTIKFSWMHPGSRRIAGVQFYLSFHSMAIPAKRCSRNLCAIEGLARIQQMLFKGNKYRAQMGDNWRADETIEQVAKINVEATHNDYVNGRLRRCNERQRQAVLRIMEARCRPSLYILFGPPGTGKTATLIEVAGQICQRNANASVLICAKSNNCVDDLAQKLLAINCVKSAQVIRLCSVNYYKQLYAKQAQIPEFFSENPRKTNGKRVVITTVLMCPKLKQKFDYVLLDEAGHANIPESLLACSRVQDDGCFVLAGDPKQLGPIVMSREAGSAGLNQSLLKQMFGEFSYGQHQGEYDPRYITKLVDSYRCDPRLLQLNSELFYRNELNCLGKTPPSILSMLNFDRPVVFKRVRGSTTRLVHNYSPSMKNDEEAEACIEFLFRLYMMGFEPDQIGIIAYYALQKATLLEVFDIKLREYGHQLNKRFKKKRPSKKTNKNAGFIEQAYTFTKNKWANFTNGKKSVGNDWHCKIDTVDAFQGNERDIIIISTTMTTSPTGFITDATRFNVATSRARWLTMVFGHPEVLNFCKFWRRFAKVAYIV